MPIPATPTWVVFVLVVGAYLVGSLSPGWWLVHRRTGADVRETGSGSTGATNAARILGRGAYVAVLVLDVLKGILVVCCARWLAPGAAWAVVVPAVIAGHIWPVFLGFRGGKGAATYLGVCLALTPWFLGALVPVALAALFVRKGFVLRVVGFVASLPLGAWLIPGWTGRICLGLAWVLVLLAHRRYFAKPLVR